MIKKLVKLVWLWWAIRSAKDAALEYDRTHLYPVDNDPPMDVYDKLIDKYLELTHQRDAIIKSFKKQS